jgi:integrase
MPTTMRLKHVQRIDAPASKGGGAYWYFRPTRQKFSAAFGTTEFLAEWQAFMAAWEGAPDDRPGSLGELIAAYRAAPEFRLLAPDTRSGYQRAFDRVAKLHAMPLSDIDAPMVLGIRDRVFRRHRRHMANYVVTVLRIVFEWGIPRGHVDTNPAAGVPRLRRPRSMGIANRPWKPAEFAAVAAAAPQPLRLALHLGRHAGLRISDVVAADWRSYDGRQIELVQSKTGNVVTLAVTRALRSALDEAADAMRERQRKGGDSVLSGPMVRARHGRRYTRDGLQSILHRLLRKLEEERAIAAGLTFHGLRKSLGTDMAEAGIDELGIAAALGSTPESSRVYTRPASQKRRAARAFGIIDGDAGNASSADEKRDMESGAERAEERPGNTKV